MPSQYAYATDLDALIGELSALDETRKNALLEMASRLYDRVSETAPGHWGPVASTAYTFDAQGGELLRLRDEAGLQYLLRTITADSLQIDDDLDGTYEYALDLANAWVEGYPRNAVAHGEAFTALRFKPTTAATVTQWPNLVGSVRITGTWGYPAVPAAVKTRVIDIAHGLSQRGYAGGFGTDEALQVEDVPVWVVRLVDSQYSHYRRKVA